MHQVKFNGGGQGDSRPLPNNSSIRGLYYKRQRALALIKTFTQKYPQPPYPHPPAIPQTRLPYHLLQANQPREMNAWLVANAPDLVDRARLQLIRQERAIFRDYLREEAQYQADLAAAVVAADIQLNLGNTYYGEWRQLYNDVFHLADLRDDLNDLLRSIYTMAMQYMDDIYHEYARRYAANPLPMYLNGRNIFRRRYLEIRIALMRLTGNVHQRQISEADLEDLELLMKQHIPLSQHELPHLDDMLTAIGEETGASIRLRQSPLTSGFITAQDRRQLTLEEQYDKIQDILSANNPPLTPQQTTALLDDADAIEESILMRDDKRDLFTEHKNRREMMLSHMLAQNSANSRDPAALPPFEPPHDVPEVLIDLWIKSTINKRPPIKDSMIQWVMKNRPDIAEKGVGEVEAYLSAEIERTQERRPSARERYEEELAAHNMAIGNQVAPPPPPPPPRSPSRSPPDEEEGGGNKRNNKKSCSKNKCKKNMKKQFGGKWSLKYKKSINCNRPKGFSQKQHCKYRNKNTRKNNK
jgi:hypothetical protein